MILIWDHHECPSPVRVDEFLGGRERHYRGTWHVPEAQIIGLFD